MKKSIASHIASLAIAIENCVEAHNTEWQEKHNDRLDMLIHDHLPHGSGFDSGVKLIQADDGRITLYTAYHCMNEGGFYDGWIDYKIIVKPSLAFGIDVKVIGRDYKGSGLKDYVAETFQSALSEEIEL